MGVVNGRKNKFYIKDFNFNENLEEGCENSGRMRKPTLYENWAFF